MSNSQRMTLEERLVQHIKDTGLGALIDDEDAITELTRRAVEQALFQKRTVKDGSWNTKEVQSPVVAAATAIADKAIEKIVNDEVEKLMANPDVVAIVKDTIAAVFPQVIKEKLAYRVDGLMERTADESVLKLREAMRNGMV